MNRTIALLLITCGLLFGCDEDNAGDDAADSAEDSSSSDAGESGSDGPPTGHEQRQQLIDQCAVLVDCIDVECTAERQAYEACRETSTCGFDAFDGFEACAMECAQPDDFDGCPDTAQDCPGAYDAAWFVARDCVFTELSSCELDGAALCEAYY